MHLGAGGSKDMSVTKTSNCLVGSKQLLARAENLVISPGARPTRVVTAESPGHQQVSSGSSHRAGNLGE